jgi:hypothetical protein
VSIIFYTTVKMYPAVFPRLVGNRKSGFWQCGAGLVELRGAIFLQFAPNDTQLGGVGKTGIAVRNQVVQNSCAISDETVAREKTRTTATARREVFRCYLQFIAPFPASRDR